MRGYRFFCMGWSFSGLFWPGRAWTATVEVGSDLQSWLHLVACVVPPPEKVAIRLEPGVRWVEVLFLYWLEMGVWGSRLWVLKVKTSNPPPLHFTATHPNGCTRPVQFWTETMFWATVFLNLLQVKRCGPKRSTGSRFPPDKISQDSKFKPLKTQCLQVPASTKMRRLLFFRRMKTNDVC